MYCPTCGHRQNSEDIRFCSKCGFLLTGISQVVHNNGMLPQAKKNRKNSPRSKGIRKGVFTLLLSLLVIPFSLFLSILVNHPIFLVLGTTLIIGSGILRIAYAMLFESDVSPEELENMQNRQYNFPAYVPHEVPLLFPESADETRVFSSPGIGKWKDSKELVKEPAAYQKKTNQL